MTGQTYTLDEYKAMISGEKKKKNKYHAKRDQIDGFSFDSKVEAQRYLQLKMLAWNKVIDDLQVHPCFVLLDRFVYQGKQVRGITYEADFGYYENGIQVIEDVKGFRTKEFMLKEKLFKARYPQIDFRILS